MDDGIVDIMGSFEDEPRVGEEREMRGVRFQLDCRKIFLRHLKGDGLAFAEFVSVYRAPIYSYLVRSAVHEAARDDLFQEILIKVHNGAASYQAHRPLNPWVFAIVCNSVRSYFRKERVQKLIADDAGVEEVATKHSLHDVAEARESARWLEEAIQNLPLAQREVVILVCIECLSQKEVAESLAIPLSTVKTNLRRARMTLAKALARRKAQSQREGSL